MARVQVRNKRWSTHIPMLVKALLVTDGPVLELGAGPNSTPLIHWLCAEARRTVVTYENKDLFYKFAKEFISKHHSIRMIDDWKDLNEPRMWSVVLIDHDGDRGETAIRFKDNALFLVCHDTEPEREKLYHYEQAYPHFKYRYDWTFSPCHTTVLSNFLDITQIAVGVLKCAI